MNGINPSDVVYTAYDAVFGDPKIEGLFNMLFVSKHWRAFSNPKSIKANVERFKKPVFFWLVGEDEEVRRISRLLGEINLPTFASLEDMVKNFKILQIEANNKKS